MKRILFVLSVLLLSAGAFAKPKAVKAPSKDVTVFYTNDVHTHIEKDLNYSVIAGLKAQYENEGLPVVLADIGDHSQGTAYGGMDQGNSMIDLMNAAKYDVATIGNHEFDYGFEGFVTNYNRAKYKYTACNFFDLKTKKTYAPSYIIMDKGDVKVAFVGVMTPETISKSSPAYFMDKDMKGYIYDIKAGKNGKSLYKTVQKAVNKARKEADYVIILSHLGVDESSKPYTSKELIANTTGIDAVLDGHSHTTIEKEMVANKKGQNVLLSQTGCYFDKIGRLVINKEGKIDTKLLGAKDINVPFVASVKDLQDQWKAQVDADLNTVIAECSFDIKISDAEGKRLVRKEEVSMGDFVADGFYYYLNEVEKLDCDVCVVNGGGVRSDVKAGDWSYLTCKTVSPFGNVLCMIRVSGKTILDMLEFGERFAGSGSENGGFMQVAGLTFDVDSSIPNTVKTDDSKIWTGSPDKYRVNNVKVYNKKTGQYDALDVNKSYTLGSINYTIRNMGDGFAMFGDAVLEKDYIIEDYLASARYAGDFKDVDGDGKADISSATSPLAKYKNYKLNYENIGGAGRINIK